jgi:hypothetical protein
MLNMERMQTVYQPGMVGKRTMAQIAQAKTWTMIPEGGRVFASMHVIHVVPENGSTTTLVNPTDPGDECYYERPASVGPVVPAGKMRF